MFIMKNKKNIWMVGILLLVVGCKSTNLSCTKTIIDTEDVKVNEKISLNFEKKKLKQSFFTLDYYYGNNVESNAQLTRESLEEQFSNYKDSSGVEYFFTNIEEGIHFELQVNPEKLTEEEKTFLEKQVNYKDYNSARETLASDGYQCK